MVVGNVDSPGLPQALSAGHHEGVKMKGELVISPALLASGPVFSPGLLIL